MNILLGATIGIVFAVALCASIFVCCKLRQHIRNRRGGGQLGTCGLNQSLLPTKMVQIEGSYKLEKNENLEEYYQSVGVPWFGRKLMLLSSPTMEFYKDEEDQWVIKTVTFFRTMESSFKLNEEYDDLMPGGTTFKSITVLEGNKLTTTSKTSDGGDLAFEREYEFSDTGMIMTLRAPQSTLEAKRYFRRLPRK